MASIVNTHSDGVTLTITSSVHSSKSFKIFLTVANIAILLLHAFAIFEIEIHEVKRLLIPTCISMLVFIYLPWRYWLWKFYGKEHLIINDKELTYYYDYGFFKTKAHTLGHTDLKTAFEKVKEVDGEEFGTLHLFMDDLKINRRKYIHQTTIPLPATEIHTINSHLSAILRSEQRFILLNFNQD